MSVAPDTSVLIAGFLPNHAAFETAKPALQRVLEDGSLVAHTTVETFSTLTASPFDISGETVVRYLRQFAGADPRGLLPGQQQAVGVEFEPLESPAPEVVSVAGADAMCALTSWCCTS